MATAVTSLNRPRVLWLGTLPGQVEEFERRGLELRVASGTFEWQYARALIIEVDSQPVDVTLVKQAIDQGLEVWVVAQSDAKQQDAWNALNIEGLTHRVVARTDPTAWEIAERIARIDPSRAAGEVSISGADDSNIKFLLSRAFSDCKSVLVKSLSGGFSATAFRVHAVFRDSAAGPRPLPFFAKVDGIEKIGAELDNYGKFVDRYIPFYLRPHLDHARCILGSSSGMLVGDFVEQSESLADVLPRGRGTGPINSLFDEALRGWRLQAFQTAPAVGKMAPAIFEFRVEKFDAQRVKNARQLGAVHPPEQLIAMLADRSCTYRVGPMHGDLHGGNVQVRGNDAILIDFMSTRIGPIVADPASLEVSVAFSCPSADRDVWRAMVDRLYGSVAVEGIPDPPLEPSEREWVWSAVRQVRMHAKASRPAEHEYQTAVATYLLRRASFPALEPEDEYRRTYAYVLADQIIRSL